MIRIMITGLLFIMSSLTFATTACGKALPIDNPNFCSSFKTVATCYCTAQGIPAPLCQNMKLLYARMISVYKKLEAACANQPYTSQADCVANWSCYVSGKGQQQTDDNRIANCARVCEPV